jgi:hypothetical protein
MRALPEDTPFRADALKVVTEHLPASRRDFARLSACFAPTTPACAACARS